MSVLYVSALRDPDSQSSPYLRYWCPHSKEKADLRVNALWLWKDLLGHDTVISIHISLAKANRMATPEFNRIGMQWNATHSQGWMTKNLNSNLSHHCILSTQHSS